MKLLIASHNGRRGSFQPRLSLVKINLRHHHRANRIVQNIPVDGIDDKIRVMGLACKNGKLMALAGSDDTGFLATFDDRFEQTGWHRLPELADPHGIVFDGDSFFVVSSRRNEVIRFTWNGSVPVFAEVVFRIEGDHLHHINDLTVHQGSLLVCAMGGPAQEAHHFNSRGYIVDVARRKFVKEQIDQPHSLVSYNGNLFCLESRKSILWKGETFLSQIPGYLRGLAIDPSTQRIFVGSSSARPPRDQILGDRPNAKVWILDANGVTQEVLDHETIAPEIHALTLIP